MLRLHARFITTHQHVSTGTTHPTTPTPQPLTGITQRRFSLIRFRSPLLTESLLFSLPAGTEMFHFPAFPPHTLYIQVQVTGHNSSRVPPFGNPRISPFIDSPRLIADYYGLHRFLVPRHPPCALKNLTTTHQPTAGSNQNSQRHKKQDARVHYAILKQHTHHTTNPHHQMRTSTMRATPEKTLTCSFRTQQCADTPTPHPPTPPTLHAPSP